MAIKIMTKKAFGKHNKSLYDAKKMLQQQEFGVQNQVMRAWILKGDLDEKARVTSNSLQVGIKK